MAKLILSPKWPARTELRAVTSALSAELALTFRALIDDAKTIMGLTGEDEAVAYLIDDETSDTHSSLAASYVGLSGDQTVDGTKTFGPDAKIEFNGAGFTPNYDTDLWIASKPRVNPTINTQGLYIQHRVQGDLGGFVNDAGASELRLSGATNTGAGQSAHEDSLVITGGVNSINLLTASLANFHTSGTPTGTVGNLALFRATQAPPLPGGFTVTQAASLYLENQIIGTTNYTIWAGNGDSVLGPLRPKDSTGTAVIARGRADTVAGTALLSVQNSTPTTLFQVTSSGTGGIGGIVAGSSWWVNNNNATGATKGLSIRGHSAQSVNLLEVTESGGAAHVFVTAATASKKASLVVGNAALATNATDGFIYAPTTAGAPSGTPTAQTGTVPVVVDTTNSKLYAYIGGAWKGVTLT